MYGVHCADLQCIVCNILSVHCILGYAVYSVQYTVCACIVCNILHVQCIVCNILHVQCIVQSADITPTQCNGLQSSPAAHSHHLHILIE